MLAFPLGGVWEEAVGPADPTVRVPLSAAVSTRTAVRVLRVVIGGDLAGRLKPGWTGPLDVPAGAVVHATFRLTAPPPAAVAGEVEFHLSEAGVTAVRTLRLVVWPDRPLAGAFGIDFGATRIAAAYIPPATGRAEPVVLRFDDQPWRAAAFATDGSGTPPRGVGVAAGLADGRAVGVFHRPRHGLRAAGPRTVPTPTGDVLADGPTVAVWALDHFLRAAGRAAGGTPPVVELAVPASLAPSEFARLRRAAAAVPGWSGRLADGPPVDEATAVAVAWLHESEREVAAAARAAGRRRLRVLVVDAGASAVEASLLELDVAVSDQGRLAVGFEQVVRDGFGWLAGDRVTAALFRRLKRAAADALAPVVGIDPGRSDAWAELVVPTRFLAPRASDFRYRNFSALWEAAEQAKMSGAGRVRVGELTTTDGRGHGPLDLPAPSLADELAADADHCLARLRYASAGPTGEAVPVDYLLVAGGAARLDLFQTAVVGPLRQLAARTSDWTTRGKEAVACGAALAAFHRTHAPDASDADRLALRLGGLGRRLPFSVLVRTAGREVPRLLVSAGEPFPDGGPIREPIARQLRFDLFRLAGEGPLPPTAADAHPLLTYLGSAVPPDGDGPLCVEVDPDFRLRVRAADGRAVDVEIESRPFDPLDEPFGGQL